MPETILNKTVVAVHGIGDQFRSATIQQVLTQFALYHGRSRAVPLGQFNTPRGVYQLTYHYKPGADGNQPKQPLLVKLNFAEAYWANIPRAVVTEGFQIEDARKWARTIVRRIHERAEDAEGEAAAAYRSGGRAAAFGLAMRGEAPAQITFAKMEEVLTEMLQTLGVLDKLFFLAAKLKLFTFDLNKVLEDFLDDVQVVAEFQLRRESILQAFNEQMETAYNADSDAEIYIVAHSEGTVISFIGLLDAARGGTGKVPDWLARVRGLMTIGSPIDKHIELWPGLFAFYAQAQPKYLPTPEERIEWRNYYDFGDPVGYELDETRRLVKDVWPCGKIFNFTDADDYGFARYALPGEAHNEYWTDDAVFGHFIKHVVYPAVTNPVQPPQPAGKDYSQPPRNKHWMKLFSHVIPYAALPLLLFCAVLFLYRAVGGYAYPDNFQLSAHLRDIGALTCLLSGLTYVARIVRLTRPGFWWITGIGGFVLTLLGYAWFNHAPLWSERISIAAALVFLASLAGGLLLPRLGMWTLLLPGLVAVAVVIEPHLQKAISSGAVWSGLWPVLLWGAFFLCLWWLVALTFDLVFVWHRYIRYSQQYLKV